MFGKNRKGLKIFTIVVVAIFLIGILAAFLIPLFARAAPTTLSDQVKAEQAKQAELQKQIDIANDQKAAAMDRKKAYDNQISILNGDIDTINAQLNTLQAQIDLKNAEIAVAQKTIDDKQTKFKQRIRVLYEEGGMGYLESLFQATSVNDFLYRYEMVQEVLQHDKDLITEMQAAEQTIETDKAAIEQNRATVNSQKATLVDKKNQAASAQKQQQALMDNLQKDAAEWQKQLDASDAAEKALKQQMAGQASNSSNSTYTGGKFEWPVPGYYTITSVFSSARLHPVLGVVRPHDGIDISAPSGANVIAAGDGTVIYSGWNSGYGNCIMIDHGGGYVTLYGHASSLLVSKGDKVARGQSIMKIGMTGLATGPHLHFEVEINGTAVEPTQYLKK